ncbi:serine/threonine-protein kinase [soil metagenome]
MDAERLKKIEELYNAVLDVVPDKRQAFLKKECGEDRELHLEVESLLSFENNSQKFLDTPFESLVAEMFSDEEKRSNLTGKEISHYKIRKLLGKGGMGEVYLADDTKLNRQVAIKILPAELIENHDRLRRFELEAKSASALNHPNILTIHEFGNQTDLHYIVMEFVNGKSLSEKTADGLTLGEKLDIISQVASALSQAHEAGIVHRDIKPENILIRRDGYVKVLDFGLAKLIEQQPALNDESLEDPTKKLIRTGLGVIMGTAPYMSPEQARGVNIDTRTDIWSLGVCLYEMLTGRKPFSGETHADIIAKLLSSEPPPVSSLNKDIPAELDWIVSKALTKDVEARYQTAKEFRADLEKIKKNLEFDDSVSRATETLPYTALTNEEKNPSTVSSGAADDSRQTIISKSLYPIFALVLLALISVAAYFAFISFTNKSRIDSIAVLPFENSTKNSEMNFVSDGLSEALIDHLSQFSQLKVIARNSSFSFRGANNDLREIASKLGVQAVVTGNVTQIGDELSVRFDVVDPVENTQITGGQFRRKVGDLLSIQNEIARMIAGKLELKLTSSQSKRLAENATENSEAYRYYLSGLVELNGPLDIRSRALEYFEKAVALDPDFAEAHTEIAWIYWSQANNSSDPHVLMPKAKAATERAFKIDPDLAKAHVLKAMVSEYEFDWQTAESEYKKAIELSPNLDFALNNYAFFLSVSGRQDEALAELEQNRIRDPLNRRLFLLQKGIILTQAHRFDDALEVYREAGTVEPTKEVPHFSLGYAYGGKGLNTEAANAYKKSVELLGGGQKYSQPLVYLAAIYAKIPEKRNEAREILTRIEAMSEYKSPAILAVGYTALDDRDKAIGLLEQAYKDHDPLLRFIGTGYEYDGLRSDPRFIELTKRIGFEK